MEDKKDSMVAKLIQWGFLLATFGAATAAFWQAKILANEFQFSSRPYLTFESPDLQLNLSEEEIARGEIIRGFKLVVQLTNTGKIPARFKVSQKQSADYDDVIWTKFRPEDGIIFPGQKIELGWFLEWDEKSDAYEKWLGDQKSKKLFPIPVKAVRLKIDYASLSGKRYQTTLESEATRAAESKSAKAIESSWKVISAD